MNPPWPLCTRPHNPLLSVSLCLPVTLSKQELCHSPCCTGWEEKSTVATASSCLHVCSLSLCLSVRLIMVHPAILLPQWLPQASMSGGRKEGLVVKQEEGFGEREGESVKGCLSWSWSTSLEPLTIEGLFGHGQGQVQVCMWLHVRICVRSWLCTKMRRGKELYCFAITDGSIEIFSILIGL